MLDLGSVNMGDLTINAEKATEIKLSGSSASVASLTINAPNASVENNVTVNGPVNILAVPDNTFDNNAITGIITISGRGAVNDMRESHAKPAIDTI